MNSKNIIKGEGNISVGIIDRFNPQSDNPLFFETVTEWLRHAFDDHENSSALHYGPKVLSYKQLNKKTNRIANYLIEKGIRKGDRVGLSLNRSIEMISCIIGILKSGAAYVPLDPNYPADRLEMMKEDAKLSLLITHKVNSERFDGAKDTILIWEDIEDEISSYPNVDPLIITKGEDIAYVIFTSGSTGRPKGIVMPHRALSNLVEWQIERSYFKKGANVLQYSSISFDVSFQEIVTTLASGGSLFLVEDEERRDPRILLRKLEEFKIERLFIPFVALRSLVEVATSTNSMPDSLREVITAGEQLRVDTAVREFFSRLSGAILDNQYGPSETHVISAHLLGKDPQEWPDLPSIGTPLKNTSIYILDEEMQPVETGKPGELYLAGRNLAHGYIDQVELTKKSFIPNPFDKPDRPVLYKTGDLGRYQEDGSIEFLGRSDHQIKIRGYRIEPGEINNVGAKFPGVAQCITHNFKNEAGIAQLITYVVPKKEGKIDKTAFKAHLAKSLPEYMIPAFIMEIEKIPYTPSGKVDLKALPKPENKISGSEKSNNVIYKSETEAKLAQIWNDLLGIESVPRASDFFDLGGDSLIAVTLFLEIEKQFGKVLPLSTLAQAPTLSELSVILESLDEGEDFSKFRSLQVIQKGDKDKVPLFLIHGGAGNVLMFRDLSNGLDAGQPIFAFQWPGWDGFRGENNILSLAKFYKKELLEAWPSGPYRLGGHCIGGIIALKLAQLLREDGAEVIDPILVTDAPNLHATSYRLDEPESSPETLLAFKKITAELKARIPQVVTESSTENKIKVENDTESEQANILRRVIKEVKKLPFYGVVKSGIIKSYRGTNTTIKNRRNFVRPLIIWSMLKISKPIPIKDRAHYSGVSLVHAVKNNEKIDYKGDILYFRSGLMYGRFLGLQGWWDDVFMGFGEACSGHFDAYVIGGEHNNILKNPDLHKIIREKMFSAH